MAQLYADELLRGNNLDPPGVPMLSELIDSGHVERHRCAFQRRLEAPPFKNGGFTMTLSRLFQGAMPPERHLLNKVFAADLFPVPPCSRNSAS